MVAAKVRTQATRPLKDYRVEAQKALTACIESGEPFTADSIRLRMDPNVTDVHHNVLPAMISNAQRRGEIVRVGVVKSPNKSRHGGWNALWLSATPANS